MSDTFEPANQTRHAVLAVNRAHAELVGREPDPASELLPLLAQMAKLGTAARSLVELTAEAVELLKDQPDLAVTSEATAASPATAAEWLRGDLVAATDHLMSATAALTQARDAAARLHIAPNGENQ